MSNETDTSSLSLNDADRQNPDNPAKDWTVMIYMAGDNNLSADMAYALADLGSVRNENTNLLVYYDSSARGAPTLYGDFTDAGSPVFTPSHLVKKSFCFDAADGGANTVEENSASVHSLLNFVDWCVNESEVTTVADGAIKTVAHAGRRAKNYALVLSGHSSGFVNMSLLVDSNSNLYMTVPQLRRALEQMTKTEAPFKNDVPLLKQKIGILGFDSCVMGMAELGYEFRRVAETLVASEGSIPSAGWTYGNILAKQVEKQIDAPDARAMAAGIVRDYIEKQTEFLIGGVSVDLAAWDLSKVEPVIEAVDDFGAVLLEKLKGDSFKVRERLKRAIIYSHWECQSYMSEQNVDLKDFCQLLRKNIKALYADEKFFEEMNQVLESCRRVSEAVDECVLMAGFSGGSYQHSNGISLFFPWTERSYEAGLKNYAALKVLKSGTAPKPKAARLGRWNEFLREFTGSISLRESRQLKVETAPPVETNPAYQRADDSRFYPPENARNNPLLDNNRNNPLLGNDRNNPLLGNDRNNPLLGNDRNNPLLGNDRNNPLLGNDRNNPLLGNDRNNPLLGNDRNNPLLGNDRNNPLLGNDRNNPSSEADRNNPLLGNDRNNPLLGNDRNNPLLGNDRNNPLLGNDRNNPLLGNDRNNPLLGNDRNNPLLGNDRNNPLLGNDRGLQLFIMNQFKNLQTPWNISGFTKAEVEVEEQKKAFKKKDGKVSDPVKQTD